MTNTFCSITRSALFAAAMLAGAPSAGAQEAGEGGEDEAASAPRVEINLAGIDLTRPEGIDMARRKIREASRTVCEGVLDPGGMNIRWSACVHAARDRANQQLEALQQKSLAMRGRDKAVDYALKTR